LKYLLYFQDKLVAEAPNPYELKDVIEGHLAWCEFHERNPEAGGHRYTLIEQESAKRYHAAVLALVEARKAYHAASHDHDLKLAVEAAEKAVVLYDEFVPGHTSTHEWKIVEDVDGKQTDFFHHKGSRPRDDNGGYKSFVMPVSEYDRACEAARLKRLKKA